jgi:selenocysteine lyase/cysteine desulfurase
MPNFASIYVLRRSIEFLRGIGIERLDHALRPLVENLRDSLQQMGLRLLTPAGAQFASGIVSFEHPEAEALGAALEERGVIVWAGDGRVRASVHLYNDEKDIKCFLGALEILTSAKKPVVYGT